MGDVSAGTGPDQGAVVDARREDKSADGEPSAVGAQGESNRQMVVAWIAMFLTFLTAMTSIFFSWRSSNAADEANRITRDQVNAAKFSDVHKTLVEAAQSLNHSTVEVRTVGVVILGHVAQESPSNGPEVRQVLASFVREHAKTPNPLTYRPNGDVQHALRILGKGGRSGFERIDLSHSYLSYEDISQLDLSSFNLSRTTLVETDFQGTNLQNTNLGRSYFGKNAKLNSADLTSATLTCATFDGTDLSDTVGLTTDQLAVAILINDPTLPSGINLRNQVPAKCR